MCGFLGWFKAEPEPYSEAEQDHAQNILGTLRHRGPDDQSTAGGAGWWLGFRRLAILDLTEHARQPMSFGQGRYTLAFNGEIYNFQELRSGEVTSSGDTAVLGSLLESNPVEGVLSRLRGMFAFAWWDDRDRSLVVARDHFGIKPLYYRTNERGDVWVGSELRSVRALAGAPSSIARPALADYFQWGAVQAPHTMIEGLHCLPPGHLLRWRNGQLKVERWFSPTWPDETRWIRDQGEQHEATRHTILDSVRAHLVSDVPVGVFLSGGLDSTLMAASMVHLGMRDVQAFSVGYDRDAGVPDETTTAERTAGYLGCRFIRAHLSADSVFTQLTPYLASLDQPTGDGLNTWLVSQVAAREVKVTLSGLGADEWFAGYNYHRLALLAMRSPFVKMGFGGVLGILGPASLRGQALWKAFGYATGAMGTNGLALQIRSRQIMTKPALVSLLGGGSLSPASCESTTHWLNDLLLAETRSYLPNTLLRDNDVTSMAHSLELRVPLVDKEVFALAGRLPPDAKLSFTQGKRILRSAFADLLPPWIASNSRKQTFTLPLMKWMRTPAWRARIEDTLNNPHATIRSHLNWEAAKPMISAYFAHADDSKTSWHLSQRVWLLFVLEHWLQCNTRS